MYGLLVIRGKFPSCLFDASSAVGKNSVDLGRGERAGGFGPLGLVLGDGLGVGVEALHHGDKKRDGRVGGWLEEAVAGQL